VGWSERPATANEAILCFRQALDVLRDSSAPELAVLRSGALVNWAEASLTTSHGSVEEAREMAQRALALIPEAEWTDRSAAAAGLRARHLLCRVAAVESVDGNSVADPLLLPTLEHVKKGLALATHWQKRGEEDLQPLAEDLFHFGCRIYQNGDPELLAKFILENLDPGCEREALFLTANMYEAATASLWHAFRQIQGGSFQSWSAESFEQRFENLSLLRKAEERLGRLRRMIHGSA
jgi:hypothetical protein